MKKTRKNSFLRTCPFLCPLKRYMYRGVNNRLLKRQGMWAMMGGVLITLLSSGQLMDFGKSFVLAIRTEIEASEGQRACLDLQCAMFAAFIWSILICIVGVVAAQNGLFLEPMEDFAEANINALCAAQPGVGVLIVLLLCPLYFRIKRRMIT